MSRLHATVSHLNSSDMQKYTKTDLQLQAEEKVGHLSSTGNKPSLCSSALNSLLSAEGASCWYGGKWDFVPTEDGSETRLILASAATQQT